MAGSFTAVDLSQLPAPAVVEELNYEEILGAMQADLIARDPSFTALTESDPALKLLEIAAYREFLLRQRVNEAAKAVLLPHATGADLDNLGAFFGVTRFLLESGDPSSLPPIPDSYESDTDFRRRIQLSLEGHSTAGPAGSYIFHGLSADSDIKDVAVTSPAPGEVLLSILSRTGNGHAPTALLAKVAETVSADDVRPLTDHVTVQSAEIVPYQVTATLQFFAGPDRDVVLEAAQKAIESYCQDTHRIGRDVTLSGLYSALHQPGVAKVTLTAPTQDLAISYLQAGYCDALTLEDGGLLDG